MRSLLTYIHQFRTLLSRLGMGRRLPESAKRILLGLSDKLVFSDLRFVQVQGHRIFIDSKDSLNLLKNGVHEPIETEIVRKIIRAGETVLDIGANIGYYTLIFAELVGPKGRVIAFEPDPDNFALLRRNIETNGYRNVVLVQKAVSNKTGTARLYLCEDNKGDHRIYSSEESRRSVDIEVVRLDDYLKDYDRKIDLVKMDIQGAEGGALEGMPLLLQRNKEIKVLTEFWPYGLDRFGTKPESYLRRLLGYGFRLFEIDERNGRKGPASVEKLLGRRTIEKDYYTNFLCSRTRLTNVK